jgi:glycosyltransferase involved in cell wall biosynthesis
MILPPWWADLWLRLTRHATGLVVCLGEIDPVGLERLTATGWRSTRVGIGSGLVASTVPDDAVIANLADDALFLFPLGDDVMAAAAERVALEQRWGCTVHLFDPAPVPGPILGFGWQGRTRQSRRIRSLTVLPPMGLTVWTGAETQAIETLVALTTFGTRVDLACSLRLVATGIDLVHLVSLRFADQVPSLQACPVPIVAWPRFWDLTETIVSVQVTSAIMGGGGDMDAHFDAWWQGQMDLEPLQRQAERMVATEIAQLKPALETCSVLIPGGPREAAMVDQAFGPLPCPLALVPTGARRDRFAEATPDAFVTAFGFEDFVLCVGRFEPRKNQAMLIRALRDEPYDLVFIGGEHNAEYAALCRSLAGPRVHFLGPQPIGMVASAYAAASVHALPAWVELPGLVNLEASMAGCSLVVGNRGEEVSYFRGLADPCDPRDWRSIRMAVRRARHAASPERSAQIKAFAVEKFDWHWVAGRTQACYSAAIAEARRR